MRGYLIFGIIICTLFFTAGMRGMVLYGVSHHGRTGPSAHGIGHK